MIFKITALFCVLLASPVLADGSQRMKLSFEVLNSIAAAKAKREAAEELRVKNAPKQFHHEPLFAEQLQRYDGFLQKGFSSPLGGHCSNQRGRPRLFGFSGTREETGVKTSDMFFGFHC